MKKRIKLGFTGLFLASMLSNLSAQTSEFKTGVYVGFPTGDASDLSNLALGLEAGYLFWEPVKKLKVGASIGYSHYRGKEINFNTVWEESSFKIKDFGFIPIAGIAEYQFDPSFFAALNLGYAFSSQRDVDGGVYYQPKAGWNNQTFQVYGFYQGITNDKTVSSLGVGAAYKFKNKH